MTGVSRSLRVIVAAAAACGAVLARADDLPTLAGPAMGTTYRVTLARDLPGTTRGEVHRELEGVLARIDRGLSTWREDSDASRFNRAAAGEWIDVAADLVAVVEVARGVHESSRGVFDITVARPNSGRPFGMRHVETRASPPAIRKTLDGITIDLGGIGPGYAVDEIGGRLVGLGSQAHLVELGGEVRAWGVRPDGGPWRVRLRGTGTAGKSPWIVGLADGMAIATSSARPGISPIDPRTGRAVAAARRQVTVSGTSCASADAWAVARLILHDSP